VRIIPVTVLLTLIPLSLAAKFTREYDARRFIFFYTTARPFVRLIRQKRSEERYGDDAWELHPREERKERRTLQQRCFRGAFAVFIAQSLLQGMTAEASASPNAVEARMTIDLERELAAALGGNARNGRSDRGNGRGLYLSFMCAGGNDS